MKRATFDLGLSLFCILRLSGHRLSYTGFEQPAPELQDACFETLWFRFYLGPHKLLTVHVWSTHVDTGGLL